MHMRAIKPSTLSPLSFTPSFGNLWEYGEMAAKIGPTYFHAACEELFGTAVPWREKMPDWNIEPSMRDGKIPHTHITHTNVTPFCRVWNFDRVKSEPNAPVFVIIAPNSGTAVQQMRDAALALLPYGHVRVIEQRDPHYVPASHHNGLDNSTAAVIKVICLNPHCHLIGFSQSGNTATVATAHMYQNDAYKHFRPASLTVIGSPINAEIAPDSLNWMATHTQGDPFFIPVGIGSPGAGRLILPGSIPKLYFEKAPGESRASMVAQALPAEHIHDTLTRVFREFWLPRGEYVYDNERLDTAAITGRVMTFAGEKDKICPLEQTHDLTERLTPNASFHSAQTLKDKGHYQMVGAEVMGKIIAPSIAQALHTKRKTNIFSLVA